MLIAARMTRGQNRKHLRAQFQQSAIPVRVRIVSSQVVTEWESWRTFWRPSWDFFAVDLRLVQRLNRLKGAWLRLLERPLCIERQRAYCWRYFGLLHHALRLASRQTERPDVSRHRYRHALHDRL